MPSYMLYVLLCVYICVCAFVRSCVRARTKRQRQTKAHYELRGIDSKCPGVNVAFASHISSTLS